MTFCIILNVTIFILLYLLVTQSNNISGNILNYIYLPIHILIYNFIRNNKHSFKNLNRIIHVLHISFL